MFGFPGIGSALVDAVGNRDIPEVQALAIIIAAVYVAVNLIADILTILRHPAAADGGGTMSTPPVTIDDPIEPGGISAGAMRQRQWKVLLARHAAPVAGAHRAGHLRPDGAHRALRAR